MLMGTSSLIDNLIAATYDPARRFRSTMQSHSHKDAKFKSQMVSLRKRLISSVKFYLGNSTIPVVSELYNSDPKVISNMYSMARAPYDVTWIEWDETERWKSEVPSILSSIRGIIPRSGMLIERVKGLFSDSLYTCSIFVADEKDKVFYSPLSLAFDTEGKSVLHFMSNVDVMSNVGIRKYQGTAMPAMALGPTWLAKYMEKGTDDEFVKALAEGDKTLEVMKEYQESIRYISESFFYKIPECYVSKFSTSVLDMSFYEAAGKLVAGDLRWMISALSFINGPPSVSTSTMSRSGKSLIVLNRDVPCSEYKVLDISSPAKKASQDLFDFIRSNSISRSTASHARRLHEVRGHWCHSKSSDKKWWRNSHRRGSEKEGTIEKEYRVKD